jgi:hypothetical protein
MAVEVIYRCCIGQVLKLTYYLYFDFICHSGVHQITLFDLHV